MKAIAIIPRSLALQPEKLIRAVENGLEATARAVQVDFQATVGTWKQKASFQIAGTGVNPRIISTSHRVWSMLNAGTRAHRIRPKKRGGRLAFRAGYRAKTTPGVLGSSGGGGARGGQVYATGVMHPGTEARDWTGAAKDKYDDLFPRIMQRAIDSEVT